MRKNRPVPQEPHPTFPPSVLYVLCFDPGLRVETAPAPVNAYHLTTGCDLQATTRVDCYRFVLLFQLLRL